MLVDTHAHLTDNKFKDDIEEVIKKCKDSTVEKIITCGTDLESSIQAIEMAHRFEGVFACIGLYPEYANAYNERTEEKLEELAKDNKVVAIGEIGLEYRDGYPDRNLQKEVFARQIALACRVKKPIVIHTRDAIGDTLQVIKDNKQYLTYGGTFHCFSESKEIANEVLKLGFYISVGGVSTFSNARNVRDALSVVPLEKMLLETDCPYLAPTPLRGQRNTPANIPIIAENLAKLKGVSVEDVARITTQNARRLFKF